MRAVVAAVAGLWVAACVPSTFHCERSEQCLREGIVGECIEPYGACAFLAPECPSGRRFGDLAGDGLGGTCTPSDGSDAASGPDATAPDATAPDPCDGVVARGGCALIRCDGCFMHCGEHVTQAGAAAICGAWGGRLARPKAETVRTCLAPQVGQYSWIALEQDDAATSFAAGWRWSDGDPFDGAWASGEPNDGADGNENGTEDCAVLDAVGLSDLSCTFDGGQTLCEP